MKKDTAPKIESVSFVYVGTDNQFNNFLKSVIHDYLSEDKASPLPTEIPSEENKIA